MAPRNIDISCSATQPTLLTDGAVETCRVHNASGYHLYLQATATATPPESRQGSISLTPSATLAADLPLADLFPGIGSGAMYLWAFATIGGTLSVSHA